MKVILSPAPIPSARRTCAFSGRRYVPERLSGNIEVFHEVLPRTTATGIDPKPRFCLVYFSFSSTDCFLSTLAKCQAALSPGYSHTCDRTRYFFFAIRYHHLMKKPALAAGFLSSTGVGVSVRTTQRATRASSRSRESARCRYCRQAPSSRHAPSMPAAFAP